MNALEKMQRKMTEAPEYADVLHERERARQKKLMAATRHARVAEVAWLEDRGGDDIYVWIFAKRRELAENERVIALVWLVEQQQQRSRLEEVVHRGGLFYLDDGTNFVVALRDGAYCV